MALDFCSVQCYMRPEDFWNPIIDNATEVLFEELVLALRRMN